MTLVNLGTFNFRHLRNGHETRLRAETPQRAGAVTSYVFWGSRMFGIGALGKMLILMGAFIILIGLLLLIGEKIPWIGRLPGDIIIRKKNFTFYFPLTTSILISIILTLLFTLFRK